MSAAVVCYFWRSHMLLLQRREDYRSGGGGSFCLPGGQANSDESVIVALARETFEETGLNFGSLNIEVVKAKPPIRLFERDDIEVFGYIAHSYNSRPPDVRLSAEHEGAIWVERGVDWSLCLPMAGPLTQNIVRSLVANWIWPLKGVEPMFPDEPGLWGAKRKHDWHTGIDLYCEQGTEILAVESGVVISIEKFTGEWCTGENHSPWWNNTEAILVRGDSGVVLYGEVAPTVKVGDVVQRGQSLGTVLTVLRKNKGRPMTMLHFELLDHNATESVWWREDRCPEMLRDPTPYLALAALSSGGLRHWEQTNKEVDGAP